MEPIYLLDLASRKSAWLAARQSVVASNVANANTPGFRAKDVTPFTDVLSRTQLAMSASTGAMASAGSVDTSPQAEAEDIQSMDVSESGNTVGVENEMTKAGEISRDYALTTNVVKSFHALLMASLKA